MTSTTCWSTSRKPDHCIGIGLWTLATETAFGLWTTTRNVSVHVVFIFAFSRERSRCLCFLCLRLAVCLFDAHTHSHMHTYIRAFTVVIVFVSWIAIIENIMSNTNKSETVRRTSAIQCFGGNNCNLSEALLANDVSVSALCAGLGLCTSVRCGPVLLILFNLHLSLLFSFSVCSVQKPRLRQ